MRWGSNEPDLVLRYVNLDNQARVAFDKLRAWETIVDHLARAKNAVRGRLRARGNLEAGLRPSPDDWWRHEASAYETGLSRAWGIAGFCNRHRRRRFRRLRRHVKPIVFGVQRTS